MPDSDFDVFISYSSKDNALADALVAYLERQGIRCWIAPRNIPAGRPYAQSIVDAITQIKVFVLIFSAQSSRSQDVLQETDLAKNKKKVIIPFRIDSTRLEGTPFEYYLTIRQWIDASSEPETHFQELAEAIRLQIGSEPDSRHVPALAPTEEDPIEDLKQRAREGDSEPQNQLDMRDADGDGVEEDPAEVAKWFRKAVEQGSAEAQYNLGRCYKNGTGVEEDPVEAVTWYQKAAKQGYPDAQYQLGICYANGEGVREDLSEAAQWYREAAHQGLAKAQYNYGLCCLEGWGVGKNPEFAVQWFREAAKQGYLDAQDQLGTCYTEGIGVEKDPEEAAK